jgi:hypothetical protein
MKSRKELIREYKERRKPAGVFMVKNTVNGKILLGSSLNLEGPLNSHRFMLRNGKHSNEALQRDWLAFGEDSFTFAVLETVAESDNPGFNIEEELMLLEEIWLERLKPFGERGYNKDEKIRQA